MTRRGVRGLRAAATAVLAGSALAACSHGGGATKPGTANAAPSAPAMIQSISNDLQVGDVVDALNRGDAAAAKKKLKAMLKRDPSDPRALMLMRSIDDDPEEMLGERSFDYRLRPGDTLRALSARYLGDADKFYALARYNGIERPDALGTGTVIRIPGDEPKTVPTPRAAPRAAPRPEPAKPTPKPAAPEPTKPSTDPARAARLRSAGLSALNAGQVDRAVSLLSQAAGLDPSSAAIKRDLGRARRVRQAVRARR